MMKVVTSGVGFVPLANSPGTDRDDPRIRTQTLFNSGTLEMYCTGYSDVYQRPLDALYKTLEMHHTGSDWHIKGQMM